MGVAADCNYVTRYGSQDNATRQILTTWNSASTLYKVSHYTSHFLPYPINDSSPRSTSVWVLSRFRSRAQRVYLLSYLHHFIPKLPCSCPPTADPARPWNIPCSDAELDARLSLFSQWRGDKGDDGIGLWHLMSGCPTGAEVGIAWLATLCVACVDLK